MGTVPPPPPIQQSGDTAAETSAEVVVTSVKKKLKMNAGDAFITASENILPGSGRKRSSLISDSSSDSSSGSSSSSYEASSGSSSASPTPVPETGSVPASGLPSPASEHGFVFSPGSSGQDADVGSVFRGFTGDEVMEARSAIQTGRSGSAGSPPPSPAIVAEVEVGDGAEVVDMIVQQGTASGIRRCPVSGCKFNEPFNDDNQPAAEAVWNHIRKKHIREKYFANTRSDVSIGNKIAAHQGSLVCKVCGKENKAMSDLETDILSHPAETIDNLEFNDHFKAKLSAMHELLKTKRSRSTVKCGHGECKYVFEDRHDQPLFMDMIAHARTHKLKIPNGFVESRVLSGFKSGGAGKNFQTRYGHGYYCHEHPNAEINQTPEGLYDHWMGVHDKRKYWCPFGECGNVAGGRPEFDDAEALLGHFTIHQPEEMTEHQRAYGWAADDDIFPFTRRVPAP